MITESWVEQARCREVDPDLFFPEGLGKTVHYQYKRAITICQRCEVRQECYEYARDNNIRDGIWGGHFAVNIRKAKRKETT